MVLLDVTAFKENGKGIDFIFSGYSPKVLDILGLSGNDITHKCFYECMPITKDSAPLTLCVKVVGSGETGNNIHKKSRAG